MSYEFGAGSTGNNLQRVVGHTRTRRAFRGEIYLSTGNLRARRERFSIRRVRTGPHRFLGFAAQIPLDRARRPPANLI